MPLRKGIVVATHPEDHSVDLVMADDGARLTGVPVLAGPGTSARTGRVDLPDVPQKADKWDITQRDGQDMEVLVDTMGRYPVVVGFLFPQINQVLPKEPGRLVERHRSDVVKVLDAEGNLQMNWPNGTYLRIGEAPDFVPVENANADASAKQDRNTGSRKFVRLELGGGTFRLTISPDGECKMEMDQDLIIHTKQNVQLHAEGNVTAQIDGTLSATVGGTTSLESGGAVTVQAPSVTLDTPETTCSGNLTVQGETTLHYVTSNGKNISDSHKHKDTMPGPGTTGTVV